MFGRIGGEEFGAVLHVRDSGEALAMADQLRRAFAAAEQSDDVAPTVSIGLALEDETTSTLPALMAAADRALYRAKAKGRNRVVTATAGAINSSALPADDAEPGWRKLPASA